MFQQRPELECIFNGRFGAVGRRRWGDGCAGHDVLEFEGVVSAEVQGWD